MTTFDKREEAFEARFALDESLKFKAVARRNKLLGLWAAEKLGKSGDEAAALGKATVAADFEAPGDDDVIAFIKKTLETGGVTQSDHQIRHALDELMGKAVAEIKAGI